MQIYKIQSNISFGEITKSVDSYLEKTSILKNSINKDVFERLKEDEYVKMDYDGDSFVLTFNERMSTCDDSIKINNEGGFKFFPINIINSKFIAIYEVMADNARRNEYSELQKLIKINKGNAPKSEKAAKKIQEEINAVSSKYTKKEKMKMILDFNKEIMSLFRTIEAKKNSFDQI